ncbi:MAG: ATP-binding protein [Wujia sp.]
MEKRIKEITVEASLDNLDNILEFIEDALDEASCPKKICMQLVLCMEEVFVNIASYAYEDQQGSCTIYLETRYTETDGTITIEIVDSGVEFNPLEKEDPDITLSADEREIGGLGIFMVKKIMDMVEYSYQNKKNILKMEKSWQT